MPNSSKVARKGYTTTDQGDGYPLKSKGTNFVSRDLDQLQNWWGTNPFTFVDPVPRDLNGVPHRWCSGFVRGGHYSPLSNFNKNGARGDGLDNLCRQCRHELYEHHKATAKEGVFK